MFGFGKKKAPQEQGDATRPGLFERLKSGLARTRHNFSDGLADLKGGGDRPGGHDQRTVARLARVSCRITQAPGATVSKPGQPISRTLIATLGTLVALSAIAIRFRVRDLEPPTATLLLPAGAADDAGTWPSCRWRRRR